jgi:xylose isomerase
MKIRHAAMVGYMGRNFDRFHQYTPPQPLSVRLDMVRQVQGVDGIEIVYPQDFDDVQETVRMVRDFGMPVAAVNLNVKSQDRWRRGSFTAPDPAIRANAVADSKLCMDLAAEFGANLVTCCPLIDGHNYAFEVDYERQWAWLVEGISVVASYRSDVRFSLEYKPKEASNFLILPDVGRTLLLCSQVNRPNVGVTVDVGHSLEAGETPAEAICLAAQASRMFYVHFNDNNRDWDWDMLPGSVNLWDMVESLFYLNRLNWEGWFAYDVMTRGGDPVRTAQATLRIMNSGEQLLAKLGRERLAQMIRNGSPADAFEYLISTLAQGSPSSDSK